MVNDDKEKLRKQFRKKVKQVSEVFLNKPGNVREEMEKIGYAWVDDGADEIERQEEESAIPRNKRERLLVDYFEGKIELGDDILKIFLAEKNSDDTNYPLFRWYFKRGNSRLKDLLLFGLLKKYRLKTFYILSKKICKNHPIRKNISSGPILY